MRRRYEPSVDCQICCSTVEVRELVSCSSGHACCQECLRSYATGALGGTGKITLPCMIDPKCKSDYPRAIKEWILSADQLKLLDEREQNESVRLANITDLNYCIFCNTAAIVTEEELVLYCCACKKSSCINCKVDWLNHRGTCEEVQRRQEKTEDALRLKYEEKMTDEKIVKCPRCKVSAIKEHGCNHMTCQGCNEEYCYVCGSGAFPNMNELYKHFCGCDYDFRSGDDSAICPKCGACSMFGDKDAEADQTIKDLQRHASMIQRRRGLRQRAVGVGSNETWSRPLDANDDDAYIVDSDLELSGEDDYDGEQEPVYKFEDFHEFLLEDRKAQRDILTGKGKYRSQPHKISEKVVDEILDFQNMLNEWIFD